MSQTNPADRRTQAERRSATTSLLLDATIDALVDLGYAGATTPEICHRAGVSTGALFHYFPTRIDAVLAALDRAVEDGLDRYRQVAERVHAAGSTVSPGAQLVRIGRAHARERSATAWTEVTVAARTDPELATRLRPTLERRWRLIRTVVLSHPLLRAMPRAGQELFFSIVRSSLEAGAIVDHVTRKPRFDEDRDRVLVELAGRFGARMPSP